MLVSNDLTETSGKTTSLEHTVSVIGRPTLFHNDWVNVQAPAGLNILQIVGENYDSDIFITLDGAIVPEQYWSKVTPKPTSIVEIYRKPQGDNAQAALILAATIALTTVTFGAGGLTAAGYGGAALSGLTGGVIGVGVSTAIVTAGIYLIGGALVPPVDLGAGNGDSPEVGRYNALTSSSNGYNLYGPVPKNYGRVWMTPPNAAKPYTEVNGDQQWINVLFALGYGPLRVAGRNIDVGDDPASHSLLDLTKIKIGDTTLDNFSDYELQVGYANDVELFKQLINETRVDSTYDTDAQFYVRTTTPDVDSATIDLTFPQGLWSHSGSKYGPVGDLLGYRFTVEPNGSVTQQTSLGALVKPTISNEYLYWRPPTGLSDGSYTTSGVYESILAGRVTIHNVTVGFTVTSTTTTVTSITTTSSQTIPPANPNLSRPYYSGDGMLMKLEYAPTGTTTWTPVIVDKRLPVGEFYVRGDRDPFAISQTVTFPTTGTYDLKLTRVAQVRAYTSQVYNDATWTVIRSESQDAGLKFTLANVIVMAMRMRATDQLSGSLDNVSVEVESLLEEVGGSVTTTATGNPGKVAYDVLTGPQCEYPVPNAQIDLDALSAWADWCQLKGLTYSWSHNSSETILQRLQAVCAAGLATWAIDGEGKFTFITDLNTTATHVITPRNSWGFSMTRQYLDLPDAFRVKYLDTDTKQNLERIVPRDGITSPQKFETLDTQGITDKDHAWKYGRYHLAQAILRPETFTVTQGAEVIGVTRGDVVKLSYDTMLVGLAWGRIKSYTVTNVTLDEPVPIETGVAYSLIVRHGDGTQSMVTVSGDPGYQDTLTWSAIPAGTTVGDLVVFGEAGKVTTDTKVTGVTPNADSSATLTLVNAAIGITDVFDEVIPPFDPVITAPVAFRLPPTPVIESANSNFDGVYRDSLGSYQSTITVKWSQPSSLVPISQVEVVYARLTEQGGVESSKQYRETFNAGEHSLILDDVIEGSWYRIRLSTISATGKHSVPSVPFDVQAFDVDAVIAAITPPSITSVNSGTTHLVKLSDGTIMTRAFVQWLNTSVYGMEGYEARYRQVGEVEWLTSQVGSDIEYTYLNNLIDGATYEIEVRALYQLEIKSGWAATTHIAVGKTEPPSNVTGLTHTYNKGVYTLHWNEITDLDRDAYIIKKSGVELTRLRSTSYDAVDVQAGVNEYDVYAIDTTGNTSVIPATTSFTIVVNAPVITGVESGTAHLLIRQDGSIDTRALLTWTSEYSSFEVRWARVADGVYQSTTTSQTNIYLENLAENDQYRFEVRALGEVIGTKSEWTVINHVVQGKSLPPSDVLTASVDIEDRLIVLSWQDIPDPDRFEYEIRKGTVWDTSTYVARVGTTSWSRPAGVTGLQTWLVKAIDTSGFYSANAKTISIEIIPPEQPFVTAQVIDNNVLLRFSSVDGTLPIDYYSIEKGGIVVGSVKGNFTVLFESSSGEYTYDVYAVDIAGNSSIAGSFTVKVSQPPDYVLNASYNSDFSGTLTNGVIDGTKVIVPVDLGQTWGDYLSSTTAWLTLQDESDAGHTNWLTPHNNTIGSYVEVYDYGAILGSSLITITPTIFRAIGAQTVTPKIEVSENSITWIEYNNVWSIYATNFRYVRFTGTETPTDNKSQTIYSALNFRLDVKLKNDAGSDTIVNASLGKQVFFDTEFVDITSLVVTPMSSTPLNVVVDFVDQPYPTDFTVYLYDLNGVQVTGNFSWAAKGY